MPKIIKIFEKRYIWWSLYMVVEIPKFWKFPGKKHQFSVPLLTTVLLIALYLRFWCPAVYSAILKLKNNRFPLKNLPKQCSKHNWGTKYTAVQKRYICWLASQNSWNFRKTLYMVVVIYGGWPLYPRSTNWQRVVHMHFATI